MLMTLEADIDYESIDGKPVNLIFVLLAPEEANDQHLMLLNEIASLLGEQRHRDYLSASASNQNLYFRFKELGEKISAQA